MQVPHRMYDDGGLEAHQTGIVLTIREGVFALDHLTVLFQEDEVVDAVGKECELGGERL